MVCLKCGKVMKCSQTSALGFEIYEGIKPGDDVDAQVKKVKCVRYCDFYKCPQCGTEIASSFADDPCAQDHQPDGIKMYLLDAVENNVRHVFFVDSGR